LRVAAFSARLLARSPLPLHPVRPILLFSPICQFCAFVLFLRPFFRQNSQKTRSIRWVACQNDAKRPPSRSTFDRRLLFSRLKNAVKAKKRPKIAKFSKKAAFFPIFSRTDEKKATFGAALA